MSWTIKTLGEIVSNERGLIQTGPFGSQLHQSDYQPEGIPVIMPTDIQDGGVSLERIAFVPEQTAIRLSRHMLKPRTIVLPRRGEITKRAFIREHQSGWLCGSGCLKIETHETELLPEYLYYFMELHDVVQWLVQHAVGSTMLNLSAGIVTKLPIRFPQRNIQQRIASILRGYDRQIENNRRRIELLEKSVRLMYEEWFVRRRFPGHAKIKNGGGIPLGWRKAKVSELASFIKRGIAPKYDENATGIALNQKCIRDGRININLARRQSREFSPERQIQVGDVLVNSTGEGTLGRVAQVKAAIEKCTVDTHVTIVRPDQGVPPHYFGMTMFMMEPKFATMGRGATNQTELSPAAIGSVEVILPSMSALKPFEAYVRPVSVQIANLTAQNDKLRNARDLLLPRLMNGEIEV